jgi:F0F1-type ATP synthase assembly protein I
MDTFHRRPDDEHREGALPESRAWNIISYLMAGLLGFGLPAWLLDQWLGTTWLTLVGLLVGMAVAMLVIWVRYGTDRS